MSSFCATSIVVSGIQTDMHKGLLETATQLSHRQLTLISPAGSTPSKTTSLPVPSILESRIPLSNPEGAPTLPEPKRNLGLPQCARIKHSELDLPTNSRLPTLSMARATIVSLKEDLTTPWLLSLPFLKPIFYTEGSDHSDLFKTQVSLAPCYVNPAGPPLH